MKFLRKNYDLSIFLRPFKAIEAPIRHNNIPTKVHFFKRNPSPIKLIIVPIIISEFTAYPLFLFCYSLIRANVSNINL